MRHEVWDMGRERGLESGTGRRTGDGERGGKEGESTSNVCEKQLKRTFNALQKHFKRTSPRNAKS